MRRGGVLTYLAFGESLAPEAQQHPHTRGLQKDDLLPTATTNPDSPRPASIKYEEVLAHGLRHLALLARRRGNDAFVQRLGARSRRFFASIEPEVAGQIPDGIP
jgi:hypothetical protein